MKQRKRCKFRFGKTWCRLVSHHPGFGHYLHMRGGGVGFVDDPFPPDPNAPNWTTHPYPIWRKR